MEYRDLLAITVYATDRNLLSRPLVEVLDEFNDSAHNCWRTYTDVENCPELFISSLVFVHPLNMFVDYVLFYAAMHVVSGIKSYGRIDQYILKEKPYAPFCQ